MNVISSRFSSDKKRGSSVWKFALFLLAASLPAHAAQAPQQTGIPGYKAMDYGPFFSATLEVAPGNIANKGIAIRLDAGDGGVARGRDFVVFDTDTLRCAAGWTGPEFIDWKNIAFSGQHEVHASIAGQIVFDNPDAPGWADSNGAFGDKRLLGRDGNRYGPIPRDWGHWKGLYVGENRVVLSYTIGETRVLESPGLEVKDAPRAFSRTFEIGPRKTPLILQVAQQIQAPPRLQDFENSRSPNKQFAVYPPRAANTAPAQSTESTSTVVAVIGGVDGMKWLTTDRGDLRLLVPAATSPTQLKILVGLSKVESDTTQFLKLVQSCPPAADLNLALRRGPRRWKESVTTRVERMANSDQPYVAENISLPLDNPYRSWMRVGGFDFFKDGQRAAVCTWQGDVWIVNGLGGEFDSFTWKRIAAGMFQPLGLKIVDETIFVTCRDQITRLRDLNGDGETDFYENFNNDAQVTEHFHEFAMDLQTDPQGNFYYAKAARHAKDALVPQHGTLLKVSKDGSRTEIIASGFRAPNGVCVNNDGTFILSDQEGHWTPKNRINWIKAGGFYGNMMGYHEGRQPDDFELPVVWIHNSFDRSPAEQLWVTSYRWGPLKGALISLSYGTGRILGVMHEQVGDRRQGAVVRLPVPELPTGLIRGRFNSIDGQLYVAGLFGWASDRTKPGGFYRVRYTGKPVHVPTGLNATRQGITLRFSDQLDAMAAGDPENYAISRWEYRRSANYGSQDFKVSRKGQIGRDVVEVTKAIVSADKKAVFLQIPDMQPAMQMEIKYSIRGADGTDLQNTIENTIHVLGEGDSPGFK
jgi:hypothetical protein